MNTGEFWASAVAAAAVAVILGELIDVGAWLAPWIIRRASAHMPTPELQARYREEWLAELEQLDGLKLIKLSKAIIIWANSWRIGSTWQSESDVISLVNTVKKLAHGIAYAMRITWRGKETENGESFKQDNLNPLVDIGQYVVALMAIPTHAKVCVTFSLAPDSGPIRIAFTRSDWRESEHIRWLWPITYALTIAFYDLYLIRNGIRLRNLPAQHMGACRAINSRRDKSGYYSVVGEPQH